MSDTKHRLVTGNDLEGLVCAALPVAMGNPGYRERTRQGFTLIELAIVVALIAILAAIALPSYKAEIRKGRRSDAQQLLMDIANKQEQYILDARAYTANPTLLGIAKDGWTCDADDCANGFYTATITVNNAATPPTWSVTATAQGDQAPDGNLTLVSSGAKTRGGASGW